MRRSARDWLMFLVRIAIVLLIVVAIEAGLLLRWGWTVAIIVNAVWFGIGLIVSIVFHLINPKDQNGSLPLRPWDWIWITALGPLTILFAIACQLYDPGGHKFWDALSNG